MSNAEEFGVQYVYFLTCRAANAVKIGCSTAPSERLKAFQAQNPLELVLEARMPGDYVVEAFYHAKFARFSIHGEWFTLGEEVEALIVENACEHFRYKAGAPKAVNDIISAEFLSKAGYPALSDAARHLMDLAGGGEIGPSVLRDYGLSNASLDIMANGKAGCRPATAKRILRAIKELSE
jgi:hypothetical protein